MKITQTLVDKLNSVLDAGLVTGLGTAMPGQFCVEAAVCYALDLPHGDDPGCVSSALRACKILLNDSPWSSDQARAEGLRKLAIAQLGSKGVLDDTQFAGTLALRTVQRFLPRVLRRVGCSEAAERCESVADLKAAEAAAAEAAEAAARTARAARAAAWAARATRAAEAADAAAEAAEAAARATRAAWAAEAAARAARAAAWAAAWADSDLQVFADLVLEVLREVQPDLPGLKFVA